MRTWPLDITQPFTRSDAVAAGVTDRRLRGPAFVQIIRGIHIGADVALTESVLMRAALLWAPNGVISGRSAARLWGAVVPDSSDVEVLLSRGQRVEARGIRVHRPAQRPRTVRRSGIPVTDPETTFIRLAAELDLVDLVVAGDSLVRRGVTTPDRLMAAAAAARNRRVRRARRAASLVRDGVDSPQETKVRLLMVLAGMPEPTVNHIIWGPGGEWLFRFDLAYEAQRLAFEYDGRQHAESDKQWLRDVRRREELDGMGWRIAVVLSPDLFINPDQTVARLVELARSHGVHLRASNEWQRHFPVRRSVAA